MNLLDTNGPPPADPLGKAGEPEIRHTINRVATATDGTLIALAWRRPGAAAQIMREQQKSIIEHQTRADEHDKILVILRRQNSALRRQLQKSEAAS